MKPSRLLVRALLFLTAGLAFQAKWAGAQTQEIFSSTNLLPPTNGAYYTNSAAVFAQYANGVILRKVKLDGFTQQFVPPALGSSQTNSFAAQCRFEASFDGGVTYSVYQSVASATVKLHHNSDVSGANLFAMEMRVLAISGGTLPAGLMVRESPTLASTGMNTIRAVTGGYRISSFFDVFTEFSVDGGQTWSPSVTAPGRLALAADPSPPPTTAPEHFFPQNVLPPIGGVDISSPAQYFAVYPVGVVIRNFRHRLFTQNYPPPALGTSQTGFFSSVVEFDLSNDNGLTFQPAIRTASVTVQVTHTLDSGGNSFFDTEILQLDFGSGGLLFRESPTLHSTGVTTVRSVAGGYMISRFFDVFTDVSWDGGNTWLPAQQSAYLETVTPLAGDINEDGIVSQSELDAVYANYLLTSPWLNLTNVAGLGGTNVSFALTNNTAGAFSVEFSTNLTDWQFLGPATPRYEFTDTNAPASPQRSYRLRWP